MGRLTAANQSATMDCGGAARLISRHSWTVGNCGHARLKRRSVQSEMSVRAESTGVESGGQHQTENCFFQKLEPGVAHAEKLARRLALLGI